MIVQCDRCQTRFKIPDAKVTDRGVKVRCTKCQNTFRVSKPSEEPTNPFIDVGPMMGGAADPFAQFSSPEGGAPDPTEQTRPGFFAQGVAASRPVGQESGQKYAIHPWGEATDAESALLNQPTAVTAAPRASTPTPTPEMPDWFSAPPAEAAPEQAPLPPAAPPPLRAPARAAPSLGAQLFDEPDPPTAAESPFGNSSGGSGAGFTEDLGADFGGMPAGPSFEADHNLFEMPAKAPEPEVVPASVGSDDSLLGDIPDVDAPAPRSEVLDAPAPGLMPAPTAAPKVVKPQGKPEAMGLKERKPVTAAGKALGFVVNVLVAGALVLAGAVVGNVWMNGGRIDGSVLSLRGVKSVFSPSRGMVTRDVSHGLYETQAGRSVLYVRGEVENHSAAAGKVKVRAEIWDGAQLVGSAEGLAGAPAGPEDLYRIAGPQDVEALQARLGESAKVVAPGTSVPFLLTFSAYPAELNGLKLKVVAGAAP